MAAASTEVVRLALLAMHPRSRSIIAVAKRDLDIAIQSLQGQPDILALEHLEVGLQDVEDRLELLNAVIKTGGPSAFPDWPPHVE